MKRMSGKKGVGAAVCFFPSSFECGGIRVVDHCAFPPRFRMFIFFYQVIHVHSLVGEVDNGVGLGKPWLTGLLRFGGSKA
jgi:hypothetical protein